MPKRGGTLIYGVTAEAPTTDCHATTTYAAIHVLAPHYSLLLKVDQDNYPKLKPDAAESWSVAPDGLTYTFKIRTNIVFHDGAPLTSKDVKASFDRIRNPPAGIVSIRKERFADIASIDAPDPATVVMQLKAPTHRSSAALALPYNCIYSADRLAQDPNFPAKTVMGSGPFVFVEHRDMQRMIISEANSVPLIWYSRLVAHVSHHEGLEDHPHPLRQPGPGRRLAGPVARGRPPAPYRRGRRRRGRAGARHAARQQARQAQARRR